MAPGTPPRPAAQPTAWSALVTMRWVRRPDRRPRAPNPISTLLVAQSIRSCGLTDAAKRSAIPANTHVVPLLIVSVVTILLSRLSLLGAGIEAADFPILHWRQCRKRSVFIPRTGGVLLVKPEVFSEKPSKKRSGMSVAAQAARAEKITRAEVIITTVQGSRDQQAPLKALEYCRAGQPSGDAPR